MTSPETSVSETEVEVADLAYCEVWNNWKNIDAENVRDVRRTALRAALTAAAQVRAQAELIADNAREDQLTIATGDELTEAMLGIRKGE